MYSKTGPQLRYKKMYVKVTSDTDPTGYTYPKSITWADGKISKIESVRDYRPAAALGAGFPGDCYTVVINGELEYLFYEKVDSRFGGRYGRWFVQYLYN